MNKVANYKITNVELDLDFDNFGDNVVIFDLQDGKGTKECGIWITIGQDGDLKVNREADLSGLDDSYAWIHSKLDKALNEYTGKKKNRNRAKGISVEDANNEVLDFIAKREEAKDEIERKAKVRAEFFAKVA